MKSRYVGKMGGNVSMHKEKRKAYILLRIPEENRTPGGGALAWTGGEY
jgi:hypothetical protein